MAKMGRPRTFDRDVAINQALHLFWEHGYDATSLSQLKANIGGGITAPSFYAAFGSKQALFNEVMERYLATHGRVTDSLFDNTLPPREAIELTLRRSAKMQCEPDHPKGCLVALGLMSACTEESKAISAPLAKARNLNRAGIVACIHRAVAAGELPATVIPETLAAAFDSFLLGLSTLARDGVPYATLDTAVTQMMGLWDSLRSVADDQ
ncbi:TetR family transcriptional regulator [Pseudomonas amygdali pv. tabaci str. ATCC 11528]|uniref:TetR family transcriptional regulator n=1 Tax=Pseudomonas amygdali pv. tabaci TaxID=322 RepID=A0A3M6HIK0_PSEAJ|nr:MULTISPECIES: TetR/AcrR family transcriptional regulator [Pseudomonas syringae group]KEZ67379.1 TetR family transcriptional regulator [Pseudomonas amygdali pv. tabaci str. ATCC 11528]KKY51564.1 TetR family transcriptional regulator [Pseudomonas amygdali pv. tabaci str. ATCC 11528]MDU8645573.1 TetR/AcrR family transcriptional regulator [Pseudomonas syringae group sp. 26L6]QED84990.1 TetR/AcrR family transcriptional regulator [Pseudomonas amygdali pv. tabaci str. ATCC 11528]RMW04721.1 TetR fa